MFCRLFWNIFKCNLKNLLDAQFSEFIEKLSTTPNAYDNPQDNPNSTLTAPPQLNIQHNRHPLSLVPQNSRNTLAVTEHNSQSHSYPQSPVSHIALNEPNIDDTYE